MTETLNNIQSTTKQICNDYIAKYNTRSNTTIQTIRSNFKS
jgi:hypothetical protein